MGLPGRYVAKINKDQMGSMWRGVYACTPAKMFKVAFEGALNTTGIEAKRQGKCSLGRLLSRRRRGAEVVRLEGEKLAKAEEKVRSDNPKGDDSRWPVKIWKMKTRRDKKVQVEDTLELLQMGILRWWDRQFTRSSVNH